MYMVVIVMFSVLTVKLFSLQILNGDFYSGQVKATTLQEVVVSAPRGTIYDRYGIPLATNKSSFIINIDASITVENQNDVILNLIKLLEKNGETLATEFPISLLKPIEFLFDGSQTREKRWKDDMNIDTSLNAEETFKLLRKKFEIDSTLSDEDAAKILSVRCELYKKRFSKYIPLTVARDVKTETITAIEEEKSLFPGIYIDVESLRNYPSGKYFSHILGYIRGISESELAEYSEHGYTANDLIGRDGLEKSFELELKGKKGTKYFEVDNVGRRISTIESETKNPVPGNKIFLTVDNHLQKETFDVLEETLKETIISRLLGKSKDFTFSLNQLLISMVDSDNVRMKDILNAEEGTVQSSIKKYILSVDPTVETADDNFDLARQILSDGIDRGNISQSQIILTLYEQKTITCDEFYLAKIKSGTISPLQVVVDKLNQGEITPQMTAMDPCTGSVVVTDINTGDVLAAVTYPSYDNNEFVNNFNNEYYLRMQNDPTSPFSNRPFTEPRAPGSTFKMITAAAALEEGIIAPNTAIHDYGTFKDAGLPYARCWIGSGKGSHGSVNVAHALEVSCNYFFYEISYRMGNSKNGETEKGIKTLNKYMELFGLNDFTGVEIYELYNSTQNYPSKISSPEYKRYVYSLRNSESSETDLKWYDGETIRTAIGQSFNNYTSATMTKYIATLANGGTRYSLHFLNKISSFDGNEITKYEPNVEVDLELQPQNLKAIYEGMYLVTSGSKGTLRSLFRDYPIQVAAKSGTAQESSKRSEHTVFVGFAPYDDPQIAITVLIPFGNDSTVSPAPNIAKKVISEYLAYDKEPETEQFNVLLE